MNKYSLHITGTRARTKLIKGAGKVYKMVSKTLGARGRNIVISKYHDTQVLHDGVKVAQEVNPKDSFEYAGAQIIKQAAQKQVDVVGDGTTVSIILGYSIAHEALKVVESGVNPMRLREALEKGVSLLVEDITSQSKEIKTRKEKIEVATISAGESELGEIIGDTWHKAGAEGVVVISDDPSPDTYVEHEEGLQIDSGFITEYFITNPRTMTAELVNPTILVTDHKLNDMYEIIPMLKFLVEEKKIRNIVIIAQDISGSALASLVKNKVEGRFNVLGIKAPSFKQKEFLQDIAVSVGGSFVSTEAFPDIKKLNFSDFGTAEKIVASKDATIITGGGGDKEQIEGRISNLKEQIEDETNEFTKTKLRERLGKLQGGIYTIVVGAQTEAEAREKKERAEDAVLATHAAIQGGIVPGGEVIYLDSSIVLSSPTNENEEYAYRILQKAIERPFRQLMLNAGYDPGQKKEILFRATSVKNAGIDVTTGKVVDMLKKGITDPTLVSIEALKNAMSIAKNLITADGVIIEKEMPNVSEKKG
jgi:chaperonin GroEL